MAKQKSGKAEGPDPEDRAAALRLFPLPPETEARLDIYAELLLRWQKTINLVAPSTLPRLWTRHFADSLQVQAAAPDALVWADLGSGGGFPGLVTAIVLADRAGALAHLIESDQRKCAFLREVSRETQTPVQVHNGRIENVLPALCDQNIEAVSARALAPLHILIGYSVPLLEKGAVGLFLKGEHYADELTGPQAPGSFVGYDVAASPSATSGAARLLIVSQKPLPAKLSP